MIITVASPDKLSISMFISFMRFCMGKGYSIATIQALWGVEAINKFIESIPVSKDIILSYYIKTKVVQEPIKLLPGKLVSISNLLVWMDLYSIQWKVLKDTDNIALPLNERWDKNMKKMGLERG